MIAAGGHTVHSRIVSALGKLGLAGATLLATSLVTASAVAQSITVDPSDVKQTIDGFGTCLSGAEAQSDWWRTLYFDDLRASMLRFDIVPRFKSPYSDYL